MSTSSKFYDIESENIGEELMYVAIVSINFKDTYTLAEKEQLK